MVLGTIFVAIATPAAFLLDAYLMFKYKLRDGDATALVGGAHIIIMSLVTMLVRKNTIPVAVGFIATVIVAIIIL